MSVLVIAELGLSHGGSLQVAKQMVDAAAKAGAGAVKVQAIYAHDFLSPDSPDYRVVKRCEMDWYDYSLLCEYAHECEVLFGATPSSPDGVRRLEMLGVDFLKNASDMLLREDMLGEMLDMGVPTYVSTGMATMEEIERTVAFCSRHATVPWTLMHCTSAYPCQERDANLSTIPELQKLHSRVGFSDHTFPGSRTEFVATALGVTCIEKHFTLDNRRPGPDHWFSADPTAFRGFVTNVRQAEELLGEPRDNPFGCELEGREAWRVPVGGVRP